jgi:hypothetical protein
VPKRTKSYKDGLIERLKDPVYALEFLKQAYDVQDDLDTLELALRDVAKAWAQPRISDRKILLEVGDGPEGIVIYESEEEGVVDWSPALPAIYVEVTVQDAMVKLGPFQLASIRHKLYEKLHLEVDNMPKKATTHHQPSTKVLEHAIATTEEEAAKLHTLGCTDCIKMHPKGEWVHLRQCLECGHVACCDDSPNQHARKHFKTTGHKNIRSIEPGEDWTYDYSTEG